MRPNLADFSVIQAKLGRATKDDDLSILKEMRLEKRYRRDSHVYGHDSNSVHRIYSKLIARDVQHMYAIVMDGHLTKLQLWPSRPIDRYFLLNLAGLLQLYLLTLLPNGS